MRSWLRVGECKNWHPAVMWRVSRRKTLRCTIFLDDPALLPQSLIVMQKEQ